MRIAWESKRSKGKAECPGGSEKQSRHVEPYPLNQPIDPQLETVVANSPHPQQGLLAETRSWWGGLTPNCISRGTGNSVKFLCPGFSICAFGYIQTAALRFWIVAFGTGRRENPLE